MQRAPQRSDNHSQHASNTKSPNNKKQRSKRNTLAKRNTLRVVVEDERLTSVLSDFTDVEVYGCADLISSSAQYDAVVVTNMDRHLNADALQQLRSFQLAILFVVEELDVPFVNSLLQQGVHHVMVRTQDAAAVVATIASVVSQHRIQAKLSTELADVQRQFAERETIYEARTVIALQMQLSEDDALAHLRTEARNQRRRVAEIAEMIVKASSILSGTLPPSGAVDLNRT